MRWIAIGVLCLLVVIALAMAKPFQSTDCIRDAIYDDAVLYAGATDYMFTLPGDILITLRLPNDLSASTGADALIAAQTDGPAEANQNRLGKRHDLCLESGMIRILFSAPKGR